MQYKEKIFLLPEHMREGIIDYIEKGIEPGGFLTAVLANDLMKAFGRADSINSERIKDYCGYLYNYAPSNCYGSYEKVRAWIKERTEAHTEGKES